MGENGELEDSEVLVSRLRGLGLRFLGPTQFPFKRASDLPMNELLRRLAVHGQPRLRLALIPLLILHPELALEVQTVAQQLSDPARRELQALYTAAVYLQTLWRTRLSFYLGNFKVLPDLYSSRLGLPSNGERHGKTGLHALAAWHARLSPFCFNQLASYNKMMTLLFEQLKMEARHREPATTG